MIPTQKIPKPILVFGAVLIFLAILYFSVGWDSPYKRMAQSDPTGQKIPQTVREKFQAHCSTCHGTQGEGDGTTVRLLGLNMVSFKDCPSMLKFSDEVLFSIIRDGAAALGRSAAMAGWSHTLNDTEIRALVAYVRSFCNAGTGTSSLGGKQRAP